MGKVDFAKAALALWTGVLSFFLVRLVRDLDGKAPRSELEEHQRLDEQREARAVRTSERIFGKLDELGDSINRVAVSVARLEGPKE